MKIVLANLGAENLGLEYLSSLLKEKGHEVRLAFDPGLFDDMYYFHLPRLGRLFSSTERLAREVARWEPDLVGISSLTNGYPWARRFAGLIRENSKTKIVFGGIHPTSVPEKVVVEDFVDFVIMGEGEYALVELAGALERGEEPWRIRNLWAKKDDRIIKNPLRPLIADLDSLPFPDKSLYEDALRIRDKYRIMASRGCIFNCSFCCHTLFRKIYNERPRWVRRRSPANVIAELQAARRRYAIDFVEFEDDVFTDNRRWLAEFLSLYKKEIALPFQCFTHPGCVNEEIARTLKEAGCHMLELGVQSMSRETRRRVLGRFEANRAIERAFQACDRVSLPYVIDHIFGLPFETDKEQLLAARTYSKVRSCARISCFWLSYFPRTAIVDIAKDAGIIDEEDIGRLEEGREPIYWHGGSVRDKENRTRFKDFEVLFKTMPILPQGLRNFILRQRLYKALHLVPSFLVTIIMALVALFKRDRFLTSYIKHYLFHLGRFFRRIR